MEKGYLSLVLHSHLPFVRHPEHSDFLEENWLFEAITETYIPLLETYNRLLDERIDFRVARELLLAQSSDWAFMMKVGDMASYGIRRTKDHILRFTRLYQEIRDSRIDGGWLEELEGRDNIFPEIDYRVYRSTE